MKSKPKTIQYLKDVCLVRIQEETAIGLLFLPQTASRYHVQKAVVLDIGRKFRYKDEVKVGDTVLVSTYLGTKQAAMEGDTRVFDGEDILAKITQ